MSNVSVFRVVSCNGPQRFTSGSLYTSYKVEGGDKMFLSLCYRRDIVQFNLVYFRSISSQQVTNIKSNKVNENQIL